MCILVFFFFFNDPATTEIYTLSLHDALPICVPVIVAAGYPWVAHASQVRALAEQATDTTIIMSHGGQINIDRKSTRLNSSHANISYAVFCLKKKKKKLYTYIQQNTIMTYI